MVRELGSKSGSRYAWSSMVGDVVCVCVMECVVVEKQREVLLSQKEEI